MSLISCLHSVNLYDVLVRSWATKTPFINVYIMEIYDATKSYHKSYIKFFKSHSYLTGVIAVQLQWHLSNMNGILKKQTIVFLIIMKTGKIMKWKKFAQ